MNSILWHLFVAIHSPKKSSRSTFFRHKDWLKKSCRSLAGVEFIKNKNHLTLLKTLSEFGPLKPSDVKENKNILKSWNQKFPQDPKFYQMALVEYKKWNQFSHQNIESFLISEEGLKWGHLRSQLQRPPLFELDRAYKNSKSSALSYEMNIRNLLRRYPFLSLKNMKYIGIRNAQPIWDRFPQRRLHEARFLEINLQPEIEELNQRRAKASKAKDFSS